MVPSLGHPTKGTSMKSHRILLIANEAIDASLIGKRPAEVLVIAPALNSRLRHWTSDEDDARRAAGLRLGRCLERLGAAGIRAEGWVGDADPLLALHDGLHFFDADEIVVATQPLDCSNWRER